MNKNLISALILSFSFFSFSSALADNQSPTVILNGTQMNFLSQPYVENNYTLVPFRSIFEALGYTISWEQSTQTIMATKDGLKISMQIGSINALVNGVQKEMQIAPELKDDHTFVPLRFVSESSGAKVDWNGTTATVNITVNVYVTVNNGGNSSASTNISTPNTSSVSNIGTPNTAFGTPNTGSVNGGVKSLGDWKIPVYSNGNFITLDDRTKVAPPVIQNNITFLPLRAVLSATNYNVAYDYDTKLQVDIIKLKGHTIMFSFTRVSVDGKDYNTNDFGVINSGIYVNASKFANDLGWTYQEKSDGYYFTH